MGLAAALYDHPEIAHGRCGSLLPSMILNVEERGGSLFVLQRPDGVIVGAARLSLPDTVAQAKAPVLDFLVVPAYLGQVHHLLSVALAAAASSGLKVVRAYAASCDGEKATIVQDLAFRHEGTMVGQLAIGAERFDLNTYVLPL